MAEIQKYQKQTERLLEKGGINRETENIQVTSFGTTGAHNRTQQFAAALQEFIVHSLNVLKYPDINELIKHCRTNTCTDFIFSCFYITSNGMKPLKEMAMKVADEVYEYYRSSLASAKVLGV